MKERRPSKNKFGRYMPLIAKSVKFVHVQYL